MTDQVDQQFQQLNVICIALIMGVLLFNGTAAALVAMGMMGEPAAAGNPGVFQWALGVPAAVLLLIAPLVEGRIRNTGSQETPDAVIKQFVSGTITGFALREAAGLLGGSVAIITGSVVWAAGLGAAAAVTMLMAWPKKEALEMKLRRLD